MAPRAREPACFQPSVPNPGFEPSTFESVRATALEGALATVRAVQKLSVSGAPPGDNCNHQEAPGKEQETAQKPGSWASIQKPRRTGLVLAAKPF